MTIYGMLVENICPKMSSHFVSISLSLPSTCRYLQNSNIGEFISTNGFGGIGKIL